MALELTAFEYNFFFALTIVVLVVKLALMVFLGKKMYDRKKKTGEFTFGFIFSVFVVITCLFISRLLYMQFDFFLTRFDPEKYYLMPNVLFWKIASFITSIGYAVFIFVTDKKVLDFKLKGIVAYLILTFALIELFYPVSTSQDFEFISTLAMVANLVAIVIPVLFFYMGWKSPEFRNWCFMIAISVILYAIGANIIVESILAPLADAFGLGIRVVMFLLSLIFKVTGLILFSYGITKFVIVFSKEK